MNNKQENKIKRWYVSVLSALILLAYTGYIIYQKLKFDEVQLDGVDYTILGFCSAVLLAVEAVKYSIRRKSGMHSTNEP